MATAGAAAAPAHGMHAPSSGTAAHGPPRGSGAASPQAPAPAPTWHLQRHVKGRAQWRQILWGALQHATSSGGEAPWARVAICTRQAHAVHFLEHTPPCPRARTCRPRDALVHEAANAHTHTQCIYSACTRTCRSRDALVHEAATHVVAARSHELSRHAGAHLHPRSCAHIACVHRCGYSRTLARCAPHCVRRQAHVRAHLPCTLVMCGCSASRATACSSTHSCSVGPRRAAPWNEQRKGGKQHEQPGSMSIG